MGETHESFDGETVVERWSTLSNDTNEAIGEQLPAPHFLWQIPIDTHGKVRPISQQGWVVAAVGDKPHTNQRCFFAEYPVDCGPDDGENIVGGVYDERF